MTLEREWMRGAAPLAVLTLLERTDMYGYELVESLERDSGGLLAMGHGGVPSESRASSRSTLLR